MYTNQLNILTLLKLGLMQINGLLSSGNVNAYPVKSLQKFTILEISTNAAVNTVDSLLKNSAINSWKVITSSLKFA